MACPRCGSAAYCKNGIIQGRQADGRNLLKNLARDNNNKRLENATKQNQKYI